MQNSLELRKINGFGKLLNAYLEQQQGLPAFNPLDAAVVEKHIRSKQDFAHRQTLTDVIARQYNGVSTSALTKTNIDLLRNKSTFCITTGHQLTLMAGPLFFTYKILTTVKLAAAYKKLLPAYDFVPVFWMATEDHDKEEINHFYYKGQKHTWETAQTGAVGRFSCDGIAALIGAFKAEFPGVQEQLMGVFEMAYQQENLAAATRYLVNELFGNYGVVIIDGDEKELKKIFLPVAEKEINEKFVHRAVTAKNQELEKQGFEPAISPREINLFLLTQHDRKRIEVVNGMVRTADGELQWKQEDFIDLIRKNPEEISPNVLLRPVYQEMILPNLAYVGGPAEIEYWLQLDRVFAALGLTVPQRVLRICATVIPPTDAEKASKTGIDPEFFMGDEDKLIKQFMDMSTAGTLDFTGELQELEKLFGSLAKKAAQVDVTLEPAVMAEKARQEKALDNIFGRIRKAEKGKHEVEINRLKKLRHLFLPSGKLQERIYGLTDLHVTDLDAFFEQVQNSELGVMNLLVTQ